MSEAGDERVVIERTYRASVEELWALWASPEGFASWWGPEGFRVEVRALEARAGGALEYDMIADAPEAIAAMRRMGRPLSHATRGRFAVFEPFARIVLVHVVDFVPGGDVYESAIEVDFHAMGDRARMVVTVHPHRNPFWSRMAVQGFESQLTKLDRRYGDGGGARREPCA